MNQRRFLLVTLAAILLLSIFAAVSGWASTISFATSGTGTAGWSTEQYKFGSCSAKLTTTTSTGDMAAMAMSYVKPLSEISSISFWYHCTAWATWSGPRVSMELDADGDGVVDHLVVSSDIPGGTTTDWTLWTLAPTANLWWYGTWDGTNYVQTTPTPVNFAAVKAAFPNAKVLSVAVYMGIVTPGAVGAGSAYIDDVTINGVRYEVDCGLENLLDMDWYAGELNKGDRVMVQKVYINDNDNTENTDDILLTKLVVTMCQEGEANPGSHKHKPVPACIGTAKAADISKIEIWFLKETGIGTVNETKIAEVEDFRDFPIEVPFLAGLDVADRTLDDDSEGFLKVVVTISNEPKNSHWIQTVLKFYYSEGDHGYFAEVGDSEPEHIRNPGWQVVDKNKFNSPLKPGVQMPVQKIDVVDFHDGNSKNLVITQVKWTNLGTATDADIQQIALTNCELGGDRVEYAAATAFDTWVDTTDPDTGNPLEVADDSDLALCSEVMVAALADVALGRTFVLEVWLKIQEDDPATEQIGTAKDSEKETIKEPGCETYKFTETTTGDLTRGAMQVEFERFICTDSDPDDGDVVISKVEVRNLGTATSDDIALIEIFDTDGNLLGNSTKFGEIALANPDGTPFTISDGGCKADGCQDGGTIPNSKTLVFKISINKHASQEQGELRTLKLQKTVIVVENVMEWRYTYIDSRTINIGGVRLALVGFGAYNTLKIKPGDEGSVDVLTDASNLAEIQVGKGLKTGVIQGAAVIFDPPTGYSALDLITVTDVIPCNTQHGNYPLDSPYEVLSWDKDSRADYDGDGDVETAVQFTAALRPERSQQPQQGCIVNIKFEYIGDTEQDIDVLWYGTEPDVFRDLLGNTIIIASQSDGTIDADTTATGSSGSGDVNGDDNVDITDAKCVALFALGVELLPACGNAAEDLTGPPSFDPTTDGPNGIPDFIDRADVAKPSIDDMLAKGLLPRDAIDITDARVIAQAALGLITLSVDSPVVLSPNPISSNVARFIATGDVAEMRVQIFDLTGRSIFDSDFIAGNTLRWHLQSDGLTVANGVYLYVVTIRDFADRVIRSEVRKLVVLR